MLQDTDQSHNSFARPQKLIKSRCFLRKRVITYYLNRKYIFYAFYAGTIIRYNIPRQFLGFPATKATIFRKPQTAERLHTITCNEVQNFPFETRCVRSSRCNYTSTEDLIKTTSEAQYGKTPSAFINQPHRCMYTWPLVAPCTSRTKHGKRSPIKPPLVNAVECGPQLLLLCIFIIIKHCPPQIRACQTLASPHIFSSHESLSL